MGKFFVELRRRSVFRVAGTYAVIGWLLVQLASVLEGGLNLPEWFDTLVIALLVIGFPIAIILAYAFEVTPEGFRLTEDAADLDPDHHHFRLRLADGVIAAGLVALVGVSLFGSLKAPRAPVRASTTLSTDEEMRPASIAVLPFSDLSPAGDQEYFSLGVAEEILDALEGIEELEVMSRTSAFAFRDAGLDLAEIGDRLSVDHVLEGSVRKEGERVRVDARLVVASSGALRWTNQFDGTLNSIFDIQDEIARSVVRELRGMVGASLDDEDNAEAATRLVDQLTDNQEAYDLFLRGRELVNKAWGIDTLPAAVDLLGQAVALDPNFVEAWKALAYANFLLPTYSRVPLEDPYLAASEEAAEKVIALAPKDPAGHNMIATLRLADNRFAEALRRSDLMQLLGPNDPEADYAHGYRLTVIGNSEAALPYLAEALQANPRSGFWLMADGVAKLNVGDLDGAMASAEKSLEYGFPGAAFLIADILLVDGKGQEAYDFQMAAYDNLAYIAPEFAEKQRWIYAGRALYLEEPATRRIILNLVMEAYEDPAQPMNTSIMNAALSTGSAEFFMKAFEDDPFANGSYVLSRLWDDRGATRAVRTHPDFPAWAERIGLREAWDEFGWPSKCAPLPGTDGSDGQFACV